MYPNDQKPPVYSIDYLNQIAPEAPKKGVNGKLKIIFIVLGVLAVLVGVLMVFSSLNQTSVAPARQLAARLQATEQIVTDAQKNIKSSELQSYNANLKLFLINTNRDITEPLANNGIEAASITKADIAKEQGEELAQTLEDARLNAVFDRTYAREITYQLDTIYALMKQVYGSTRSASLKTFLENSSQNLVPIQKQFSDFSAQSK